jgi:hypothetical protein
MNQLRRLLATPLLALGILLGSAGFQPAAAMPIQHEVPDPTTQDIILVLIDDEGNITIIIIRESRPEA